MPDYYDILDVSQDATAEQIRAAYRFHIKAFHPDKFAPGTDHARNAQRRTEEIIEAYGVLSKPHFRAEYDRLRKYTGPEHASQSSEAAGSGRNDEAQRSRKPRFQILRDWNAIFQLHILGPIAAIIIVSLVVWLLRKHQRQDRNAASAVTTPPTSATVRASPATLVSKAPPSDSSADIPASPSFRITEVTTTHKSDSDSETNIALRIGVQVRSNVRVDSTKARIQVFFYDLVENKEVVLTDADVSYEWLTPKHDWKDTPLELLSVKYRRQKKLPDSNSIVTDGRERKYLGFIVRIYYDDRFQDERADPLNLRELFPPPSSDLFAKSSPPNTGSTPYEKASPDFAEHAMKLRENAIHKVEPQVFIPTTSRTRMTRFPWKTNIVTTVSWIGERGNTRSAWDANWMENYGGLDTPDAGSRRNYIPVSFVPRQNPFYYGLPYNDVTHGQFKPEATLVIPWFKQSYTEPGRSVCKDRWLAIRKGNRTCYAQWEDCGPFLTNHFQYVFQNERPKPNVNRGAGLNVSPAVRDYLGLAPTDVTDWQFVEVRDVPPGPWRNYGDNNHFVIAKRQTEQAQEASRLDSPGISEAKSLKIDANTATPDALNYYAWFLATCTDDSQRNGKQAIIYATKACQISKWGDSHFISTLAAAYAETGQFDKAIRYAREALAIEKKVSGSGGANFRQRMQMESNLELYKNKKPYREEPR